MDPQQPQQPTQQTSVNINRPLDSDFARWLEQFNEELLYLERDFRGEYLDQTRSTTEGVPIWISSGQRVMNEKGIRYVIGELRTIANKNTYLSNLEDDRKRLYDILISLLNTLTDNLFLNHDEYALNPRHFASIIEKCAIISEFALRRPLMAGERRFLKDSETTHRIIGERPSGGGPLSFIGGIFGKGRR